MPKTKNKPGIHLHKENDNVYGLAFKLKPEYYWQLIDDKGNVLARSRDEPYKTKAAAVKSIKDAALTFVAKTDGYVAAYYDHSKKDSPLQSYL
jgi:uncharacterized protein YegP (UPF0339 family)